MKKILIILIASTFVVGNINSQVKQTVAKQNNVTKSNVIKEEKTEEQFAIEKAQVWFKERYVETRFKDPYSYRVVGIKAIPVTNKDWLDKQISTVIMLMDEFKRTKSEDPEGSLNEVNSLIKECEENMERVKDTNYSLYERYMGIRDNCREIAKELDIYMAYKEELIEINKLKNELSEEELNSFVFFDIHLDCYSKNDLGNEVLGRFVFPFTKEGVFKDDETTFKMVKKIN